MISVGWPTRVLQSPVTVQVNHAAPASTVAHALYPVDQHLKAALLLELLRHTDTESMPRSLPHQAPRQRVGQQLEKAGYKAASLQGTCRRTNARQRWTDSVTAHTRFLLPPILLPVALMSRSYPTSSTTTSPTPLTPTHTVSAHRPGCKDRGCLHIRYPRRRGYGERH